MANQSYLTSPEDIAWLREVHATNLPQGIQTALLTGNKDAPQIIEAWFFANPHIDEEPDFTLISAETDEALEAVFAQTHVYH